MPVIILELLAEGGALRLFGHPHPDGSCSFTLEVYNCSDDDDFTSSTYPASSWREAMGLLDTYPYWPSLHPRTLHPEFERRILEELLHRGGDAAVRRWQERLSANWNAPSAPSSP